MICSSFILQRNITVGPLLSTFLALFCLSVHTPPFPVVRAVEIWRQVGSMSNSQRERKTGRKMAEWMRKSRPKLPISLATGATIVRVGPPVDHIVWDARGIKPEPV